ncbi:unnamed protein product [Rhizophagus irregularis]|nr:unnamed protein product [Rhizophagus irregularis]
MHIADHLINLNLSEVLTTLKFSFSVITMSLPKKDELSKYFPSSFGKKPNSSLSNEKLDDSASEEEIEDPLRSMLPTAFGVKKKTNITSDAFSKTRRKEQEEINKSISPQKQISKSKRPKTEGIEVSGVEREDTESEEGDDDEGEEESVSDTLPISHEIKLNDHYRTVSAIALDPSGARLITGGYDYDNYKTMWRPSNSPFGI